MPNLLLVMLGGAFGSGARYLVAGRFTAPWGTLTVNLVGGLLMGALVGVLIRANAGGEQARLLLGVGVLGGFTTFSAFSLDSWVLVERGDLAMAAMYMLMSVIGAFVALGAGFWVARTI